MVNYSAYKLELSVIHEHLFKFYNFAKSDDFKSSLQNSRLLAESIAQLALFHQKGDKNNIIVYNSTDKQKNSIEIIIDGLNYKFYINNKIKKTPLSELDYINRKLIIENSYFNPLMLDSLINELGNLTKENGFNYELTSYLGFLENLELIKNNGGNKYSHPAYIPPLFIEFFENEPVVKKIIIWFFSIFFNDELPANFVKLINNTPDLLKIFQRIETQGVLKNNYNLFEKDLIYFTENENQNILDIQKSLEKNKVVLITGNPSTGKSTTSIKISKIFEENGYWVYCYSFKSIKVNEFLIWEDMASLLNQKVLFILDDCHLNFESVSNIYDQFKSKTDNACLLLTSRNIPVQTFNHNEPNIFLDLIDDTFKIKDNISFEKAEGIINLYKLYYEKKNRKDYEIGEIKIVWDKTQKSLITLIFFLEYWENTIIELSKINKKNISERVYETYFFNQPSSKTAVLLQYLTLSFFEIPFELNTNFEEANSILLKERVIIEQTKLYYTFYHTEFTETLVNSYATHDKFFDREYEDLDDFFYFQIKDYFKSFEKFRKPYPHNTASILENIFTQSRIVINKIIRDLELKEIIVKYYGRNEESDGFIDDVKKILNIILNVNPELFLIYFDNISNRNLILLQKLFSLPDIIILYCFIIEKLKNYKLLRESFNNKYSHLQDSAFSASTFIRISEAVILIKNAHGVSAAVDFFNSQTNEFYINKILLSEIQYIGAGLSTLNYINSEKVKNIYLSIDIETLIFKINKSKIHFIANTLSELYKINPKKTSELYSMIDDSIFIDKIKEAELEHIGNSLSELRIINFEKTKNILFKIGDEFFLEKYENSSFKRIANELTHLKNIDNETAKRLYAKVPLNFIYQKLINISFGDFVRALEQLVKVSDKTSKNIFSYVFYSNKIDIKKEIYKEKLESFFHTYFIIHKLNKKIAENIILNADKKFLFQFDVLKKNLPFFTSIIGIYHRNKLNEAEIIESIDFIIDNFENILFLENLKASITILPILAEYINIEEFLEFHFNKFVIRLLNENKVVYIPTFISTVHIISEKKGLYLQRKYEDSTNSNEVVGKIHFLLAKNYISINNKLPALRHIKIAKAIFYRLNMDVWIEEINKLKVI